MATFSDMKARIAQELTRDDLEVGGEKEALLETYIQRACEYYADRKFWFNSLITTAATVSSTQTVSIPATMRIVQRVTIPAFNTEVREVTVNDLDDYTTTGLPIRYAYYNDSLRLYPTPDAVYTLNVYGIAQVDAPTAAADTSIWTNEAQDLIVARVKVLLCRFPYRDQDGVLLALAEEQEALARLMRETTTRLRAPRASPGKGRYNINTDR